MLTYIKMCGLCAHTAGLEVNVSSKLFCFCLEFSEEIKHNPVYGWYPVN